jgi:hypothetical protein
MTPSSETFSLITIFAISILPSSLLPCYFEKHGARPELGDEIGA